MKHATWMSLALGLLLSSPSMIAAEKTGPDADAKVKSPKPVVAVYDLDGLLAESGDAASPADLFSMSPERPLTLLELSRSLEKAAADSRVKAVVIDADEAAMDFAQIQEVRRRLQAVRAAGKDVWLYTEALNNGTALLGSAANHFTLMPEADCAFSGVRSESMYFKGLLEKAGVAAEVIHIGDFKSFGEMFYRDGPSDEARLQTEELVDCIYRQIVADVAEGRGIEAEAVRGIIDDPLLRPADLVAKKLADHVLHRTDFVKRIRDTYGKDAVFDREYELPDLDGPEITGMMDFFKLAFSQASDRKTKTDYVAVVALEGDISDKSVAPVRSQILKLAKDDKAKALVLRVNSPGGSALASEVLWEATAEWKETGKPFVVSMGGMAASGGYYVSCGADRIFAEAGTITGSIGVVGMKFSFAGAMEKLGITSHSTQRGTHAGMMAMTRGFSPVEAEMVRKSMEKVYQTFKQRVTEGRGKALKGELEPLAGGRVFSGSRALELGLVDALGGLSEAIAHAAKAAGMDKPAVRLLPEPKSSFEGLFAKPEPDDEWIRTGSTHPLADQVEAALRQAGLVAALPHPLRTAVTQLLARLDAFADCRVMLLGPDLQIH